MTQTNQDFFADFEPDELSMLAGILGGTKDVVWGQDPDQDEMEILWNELHAEEIAASMLEDTEGVTKPENPAGETSPEGQQPPS